MKFDSTWRRQKKLLYCRLYLTVMIVSTQNSVFKLQWLSVRYANQYYYYGFHQQTCAFFAVRTVSQAPNMGSNRESLSWWVYSSIEIACNFTKLDPVWRLWRLCWIPTSLCMFGSNPMSQSCFCVEPVVSPIFDLVGDWNHEFYDFPVINWW